MKTFLIQVVALVIIIFGALFISFGKTAQLPFMSKPTQKAEVQIKNIRLNVDIADTQETRAKGLGGRSSLASNSGMLFVYDKPGKYVFWMKGLSFPLDFIWIRENTVVDIIKNAQPPQTGQSEEELPRYVPNQPVDMILEVNAGFVDTHTIQVGDRIERVTQ